MERAGGKHTALEERNQKQKQPETAAATMTGRGAVSSFPAPPSPALPLPCPAGFSPSHQVCLPWVKQVPQAALNALADAQKQPSTTSRQRDSWVPVPRHLQACCSGRSVGCVSPIQSRPRE